MAGLLLTGGASRRMGVDKALIRVDGEPLAVRLGRLLTSAVGPAFEVGPGHSGLPVAPESAPGSGPLAALSDGWSSLRAHAFTGPVIVLSCDLPRLDREGLMALRDWSGANSVVPMWRGRPQPLCARWSAPDLDTITGMLSDGQRSLRGLLAGESVEFTQTLGVSVGDADTPEELDALGVEWERP